MTPVQLPEVPEPDIEVDGVFGHSDDQLRAYATDYSAPFVDELRHLYRAYVSLLESGRDRITDLGGSCDPVDVMERNDPYLIQARRTLALLTSPSETNSD